MKLGTWNVVLLSALMVGSIACGDDDGGPMDTGMGDAGTDSSTGDTGGGEDTSTPTANIVETAMDAGNFTTLLGALSDAGLADALTGEGPFTVFAPADSAFEGVDLSGLEEAALQQILLNHVIQGAAVLEADIPARADNMADLTMLFDASAPSVNGVTISTTDIVASNGVIHVVDEIIMPANIAELAGIAGLSSLEGALASASLVDAVTDEDANLTVFAPTNAAFTAAGEVPAEDLPGVLLYHVLGSAVLSGDVPASANTLSLNTAGNGLTLLFDTSAGVGINGAANVVEGLADIRATNGVVHVIDNVLLPLSAAGAATAAGLTELLGAVGAASDIEPGVTVAAALSGAGELTVFAPTNAAFESITVPDDADTVRDILLYHVTDAAVVLAADLTNGEVPTLQGENLTISADDTTVNGESIDITDINVTTGVVHVIGGVLIPPSLSR